MNLHEQLLRAGIKAMREQGFRVIRLDRRIIPDAIAIKEKEIIALEANTTPTTIWLSKRRFEKGSQYDAEIVITKPYSSQYHKAETYYRVLELYRKRGYSYREIRRKVMEELQLKSLSISTICDWIKGRKKPLTLLENA